MIGQLLTGRYLILERLGAGGFSETYLARDKYLPHHPLCVVKALQLSSSNTLSLEAAQQLFETEAKLLESLGQHHTQIPTLLAYSHEHEQSYLIQEYIEGESLSKWLARGKRLTTQAAIKMLSELLSILAYLHAHRVIHRDLTPSNVIRRQRDGKLVLIDFGAACQLPEATETTDNDDRPLAIGTPDYMPDEQYAGEAQLNSDLYALGVLVIHLLTGAHPRQFQRDVVSGQLDWQRHLPESAIDPGLVVLLNRMVQIDFRDRYQQAEDVLADLQALPLKKYFRQPDITNWQGFVAKRLVPAVAGVLLGVVGIRYAQAQGQQTELWFSQLSQRFHPSNVHLTMVRDVAVQPGIDRLTVAPNNRIFVTAGSDHVLRVWSLTTGAMLKALSKHTATVTALNISQDSKLLVSGGQDGTVYLWDALSGRFLRSFEGHRQPVTAVAISPDSSTIVSGCKEGKIRRWDVQTGIRMQSLKLADGEVTALAYGATSDRLISASSDRARSLSQIQIWDLNTGTLARTFAGHTSAIDGLQIAGDHMLFSIGKDQALLWDLKREELATVFPKNSANAITASFNAQNIVTVHDNGSLRVWMRKAGQLVQGESSALGQSLGVALSPDHRYLVSWRADQRLRVWQLHANNVR
ncbi:MAG TPA: serine/threonine-protein kinase [Thermosynechococcaceae cyanobacterium]